MVEVPKQVAAMGAAVGLGGGYVVKKESYDNQWSTSLCQCSGVDSICDDWLIACCLLNFSSPLARMRVDGTHCCFSLFCSTPCYDYNVIRHRYNIQGSDIGDCCIVSWCPTCALRRAASESRIRGGLQPQGQFNWGKTDAPRQWAVGCCGAPLLHVCCNLYFYHCYAAAARANMDGSGCCFNCCCQNYVAGINVVRHALGIDGSVCGDCCWACCLPPCAVSRAWWEVKQINGGQ